MNSSFLAFFDEDTTVLNLLKHSCARSLWAERQFVPIGLQLLAVASPRSQELDEDALPRRLRVPIRFCELDSCDSLKESRKGKGAERHD